LKMPIKHRCRKEGKYERRKLLLLATRQRLKDNKAHGTPASSAHAQANVPAIVVALCVFVNGLLYDSNAHIKRAPGIWLLMGIMTPGPCSMQHAAIPASQLPADCLSIHDDAGG
jgi:hypothetical protein